MMTSSSRRVLLWMLVFGAVYCSGFKTDLMDVDAAQYGEISREMLSTGSYLQVHDLGNDYLDKPPFTFWICSLSMRLFGVNNVAYKLPSVLFALLAIWSVFRFAGIYYSEQVARLSALVLGSCQGLFLMTNDCRTDTLLMGAVAFAFWQLAEWDHRGGLWHLLAAAVGIGVGMLTKGPIALLVPILAFGSNWLVKKQYRKLFRPAYLLVIVVIGWMLLPMCIGLYRQFDLHPEKWVNGNRGVSGLGFYFWTQSFGRITGQSNWNNHAGIFFQLKNMLWTFFPWIFLFLGGLAWKLATRIRRGVAPGEEFISTGGFVLTYLAIGLSRYQLPHYIFIAFPMAAVITAVFIQHLMESEFLKKWRIRASWLQVSLALIFWAAAVILLAWAFPPSTSLPWIWMALTLVGLILISGKLAAPNWWIQLSIYSMLVLNTLLNLEIYPSLLRYEMGSAAGRWVHHHGLQSELYTYGISNQARSLSFYAQTIVPAWQGPDSAMEGKLLLTDSTRLMKLGRDGQFTKLLLSGRDYPVSLLTLRFLNPATRPLVTKPYYLVRVLGRRGD